MCFGGWGPGAHETVLSLVYTFEAFQNRVKTRKDYVYSESMAPFGSGFPSPGWE